MCSVNVLRLIRWYIHVCVYIFLVCVYVCVYIFGVCVCVCSDYVAVEGDLNWIFGIARFSSLPEQDIQIENSI